MLRLWEAAGEEERTQAVEEVCIQVLQPSPEQVLLLVVVAELRELVWELLLDLLS
jgi:hypothetical protein